MPPINTSTSTATSTLKVNNHDELSETTPSRSGYDAVAYFDGQAIAGDPAFSSVHNGSLYQFSSEANKQKFDSTPESFIPLYGGYCATAASEGKLFGVDPTNFKITNDNRLALFYRGAGGDTLPQWNENEAERRSAADKHWREGSFENHA